MKLVLLALIIALFSTPLKAQFCTYKYCEKTNQYESKICTRVQLSKEDADFIHSWTQQASSKYAAFLKTRTISVKDSRDVTQFTIAVVPLQELNSDLFPRGPSHTQIDGLYYQGFDIMYISYESVLARSRTLPHEMAHRLNDLMGVTDPALDEQLASDFEEFLGSGV